MVFNGIVLLWMVVLTGVVLSLMRKYKTLTGESLIETQKGIGNQQKALFAALEDIKKDGKHHIQRIGLVRFNPFSDTGGAQSFTLAILNEHQTGLVMTSLYARTGHRWYIKEVVAGKGKGLALSKEEEAAIKQAYE